MLQFESGVGNSSDPMGSARVHKCMTDCFMAVNIAKAVPLEYALPLYGYVMPILVAITTMTDSFIVVVLSQRHLRTPTNLVLLSMAIVDLLTGLSSLPWFLYYYTLKGYLLDEHMGMSRFWCRAYPFLSQIVPSIWHTASIWLTVFLAIQRYVYVCVPGCVHRFCTPHTTRISVSAITLVAFFIELPNLLGKYTDQMEVGSSGRTQCVFRYSSWVVELMGVNLFYSLHYWFRVSLVHLLPCILLIIFTYKLARTIKRSENRRRSCLSGITILTADKSNKTTCPAIELLRKRTDTSPYQLGGSSLLHPNTSSTSLPAKAFLPRRTGDVATQFSTSGQQHDPPNRYRFTPTSFTLKDLERHSSIRRMRHSITRAASYGLERGTEVLGRRLSHLVAASTPCANPHAIGAQSSSTNRMLAAICFLFLLLEVPAAFIFIFHFLLATRFVAATPGAYQLLNVVLIIRNLLIVLSSPIQFSIYCSMSEQFRLTVRQLFSSRLLFVAQAQATFHGGKRYSLILIDVDTLRRGDDGSWKRKFSQKLTSPLSSNAGATSRRRRHSPIVDAENGRSFVPGTLGEASHTSDTQSTSNRLGLKASHSEDFPLPTQ